MSGPSSTGTRATSSHAGAMVAASDATVDALFRQPWVIRTDTLHELFDVASLLSNQPLPRAEVLDSRLRVETPPPRPPWPAVG